jgi:hypothetical protein
VVAARLRVLPLQGLHRWQVMLYASQLGIQGAAWV